MKSHIDANGETASLKKRKREPKDEVTMSPSLKRQRSKAKTQQLTNGAPDEDTNVNGTPSRRSNKPPKPKNGDVELVGALAREPAPTPTKTELAIQKAHAAWKLTNPMGGRMLDIDPIFSPDERHLILTYNTSIQVYTTEDSLLARRIPLPVQRSGQGERIASSVLSQNSPEHLWVTCTDGRIWYINWTTGSGTDAPFDIEKRIVGVDVQSMESGDTTKDVLLVVQMSQMSESRAYTIVAYDTDDLSKKEGTLLYTFSERPNLIRSSANGRVIASTSSSGSGSTACQTLHVGLLRKKYPKPVYRFYAFSIPDLAACIDIRATTTTSKKGVADLQQVDVVVGGARGGIWLYSDLARKLQADVHHGSKITQIQPRKYHWHRKAVHSVKWSVDGNYLISGGSEQVLVLWQLDTSKPSFLPHLSGCIENIVVSPRGSSYAIHLDDNSTMVVSTEELKPTTYISGLQSLVLSEQRSKDAMVRRVWKPTDEIQQPLVTAANPLNPSHMYVCVGSGQQATLGGGAPSTPLLQVFDTSAFRGVVTQALARTHPTEANITSQGAPIIEPTVTKLAFSGDGKWLASVDEWQPPSTDTEPFVTGRKTVDDVRQDRREVYLKFWEVSADGTSVELVARIDEPHHTDRQETIFDIASDPTSHRFATIGDDGYVRIWASKLRKRDGMAVTGPNGQQLRTWACSQIVPLPASGQQDLSLESATKLPRSGALSFSEDGSILFAAFGEPSDAVVVAIDPETGAIHDKIYGMLRGDIRSIQSLGSCLIMLSEDLTVYDISSDELLYNYSLKETSTEAKRLTQLAANHESRTFAIAAPIPDPDRQKMKRGTQSELLVFSPENPEPLFAQTFPYLITSVFPAVSSSGFVVVDAAAQLSYLVEGAEQAPMLRPLVELGVSDNAEADLNAEPMDVVPGNADVSDDEMLDGEADVDMDADDDYDVHQAVVAPQKLADIFNIAPSFSMPPIEDLFYQVAGLFAPKLAPGRT